MAPGGPLPPSLPRASVAAALSLQRTFREILFLQVSLRAGPLSDRPAETAAEGRPALSGAGELRPERRPGASGPSPPGPLGVGGVGRRLPRRKQPGLPVRPPIPPGGRFRAGHAWSARGPGRPPSPFVPLSALVPCLGKLFFPERFETILLKQLKKTPESRSCKFPHNLFK